MQPDEEFRSRLREDLESRTQPPLGSLAADALHSGHRLRRRQRTLRAVGGVAAVAAVAVGSVTLSNAFGSDTGSGVGPGSSTPVAAPTTKTLSGPPPSVSPTTPTASTCTVPPATKVADPEWVTPRAIVAKLQQLLPPGEVTGGFAGGYAYGGGDPREMWAVDGEFIITTPKGQAQLTVTLHKYNPTTPIDGCRVTSAHGRDDNGKGAMVMLVRQDGMSVQVSIHDAALMSDGELLSLASDGDWGSLKMDKAFVQHAEATIKGDFMNPPA